jgi:hypothetical protein
MSDTVADRSSCAADASHGRAADIRCVHSHEGAAMSGPAWSVTITFTQTERFSLRADAELTAGLDHLSGRGEPASTRAIHIFLKSPPRSPPAAR